jgi:hypothetical protein
MSLTVTTSIDTATAAVRLTVAGGVAPYVADASPGGDRPDYRVRTAWSSVLGDPTARIGIDGALPIGVPTQYVITDAAGAQVTSAAVTVSSAYPLLSDATDPGRAVAVTVAAQRPNTWEARSVWWDILGAQAPFASVAPMRPRSGPLVLRVAGNVARADLLRLLAPGNPLVFRGVCSAAVDDLTLLVETVEESLILDDDPTGPALWTINYQAISQNLGPYAVDAAWSYAAVLSTFATYNALRAGYATYDALRVGDPAAGLGPELLTNGGFSAGMTGWVTFWTAAGITWDTTAGTARTTVTTAGTALLQATAVKDLVTVAGRRYRLTGRVRTSNPGTVVRVEAVTNTAPGVADYFQAGAITTPVTLTAGAAWSTFTAEITVPGGEDRVTFGWRVNGLQPGDVAEWDDLSVKVLT